jgi:hypothetical protein
MAAAGSVSSQAAVPHISKRRAAKILLVCSMVEGGPCWSAASFAALGEANMKWARAG